MSSDELREQIATEAARLLLRGKEQDFAAARKRAARWLKRKRLRRDEIPSNAEIQVQMYALAGLLAAERDSAALLQMRQFAAGLLTLLASFEPVCSGAVEGGPTTAGAEIVIDLARGTAAEVRQLLQAAGIDARRLRTDLATSTAPEPLHWELRLRRAFPCVIRGPLAAAAPPRDGLTAAELQDRLLATPAPAAPPDDEHPDAYAVMRMLLEPLARVQFDPATHPEGDALYHSLQVFELGRAERPYDEEFLLACLLHDVGWAINPRHPVLSALDALGTLVTDRTRYLIEQRPVAGEYLRTGTCPRSLRRSEEFEDVVLLARCDRDGRVPGRPVCTLDEAFDYLEGLDTHWDDAAAPQDDSV